MIRIAFNMFLALAIVLGLMWLLTRLVRRPLGGRSAGVMAVLARQPLTRGASVAVVRVGRQAYVLGVTDQHVTLLAEADPAALEAALDPPHEIREQIPLDTQGPLAGSVLSPSTWRRAVDAVRAGRKP
jgi:flagellar protein FliO/FliZ